MKSLSAQKSILLPYRGAHEVSSTPTNCAFSETLHRTFYPEITEDGCSDNYKCRYADKKCPLSAFNF